jgi:hypothetical protein
MTDFILLMHGDMTTVEDDEAWGAYLGGLRSQGVFQGGSSIGDGATVRKTGTPAAAAGHLVGFIRVEAVDLDHARAMVGGNPVYEAGGTIEIRELPRDD